MAGRFLPQAPVGFSPAIESSSAQPNRSRLAMETSSSMSGQ